MRQGLVEMPYVEGHVQSCERDHLLVSIRLHEIFQAFC